MSLRSQRFLGFARLSSHFARNDTLFRLMKEVYYCPGPHTELGVIPNYADTSTSSIANFVTDGGGWDGPGRGSAALTYFFRNSTPDLPINSQRNEMIRAFHNWAHEAAIFWSPAATANQNKSVDVLFTVGDHGDNGFGTYTIAHAFSPVGTNNNSEPVAGDIHFNDAYDFYTDGTSVDMFSVTLHEVGHSLGLGHNTTDPNTVMYKTYHFSYGLTPDDIAGIKSIYADGDTTNPTVSISQPIEGGTYTSFPTISGTTADNAGGTGLYRVRLDIQRLSDGKFWNGSSWASLVFDPIILEANLSGNNWSYTGPLPSGANLSFGQYQINIYSEDRATNISFGNSARRTINIASVPSAGISTPAYLAVVNTLSQTNGTVSYTGIVPRLRLWITRNGDGANWNGSTWVAGDFVLTPTVSGNTWSYNSGPPTSQIVNGQTYRVLIRADYGDGTGGSLAYHDVTGDLVNPSVTFTSPTNGAQGTSLKSATGTVSDLNGIARVDYYIRRMSDYYFWNGSAWTPTATPLPTYVSSNTWTFYNPNVTANVGSYALYAYAYDRANNLTSTAVSVTVVAALTGGSSTVVRRSNLPISQIAKFHPLCSSHRLLVVIRR